MDRISDWLNSVRCVVGKITPVGLGLHAAIDANTIDLISTWPVDFIAVHDQGAVELLIGSVSSLRTQMESWEKRLPIIVETSIKRVEHLVKLIALGVSAVSVDGCLTDIWTQSTSATVNSFLGKPLPTVSANKKCPIATLLEILQAKLVESMQLTRSTSLSSLANSLLALSPVASRMARIPMVGE